MILQKLSILLICLSSLASCGFVRIKNTEKKTEKEPTRDSKKIFPIIIPVGVKDTDRYEGGDRYQGYNKYTTYEHEVPVVSQPTGAELYKTKVQAFEDKLKSAQTNRYKTDTKGGGSVVLVGLQKPSFGGIGSGVGAALQGIRYGLSGAAALVGGKVGALAGSVAGTVKGAVLGAAKGAAAGAATGAGLVMSVGDTKRLPTIDYKYDEPITYQQYRPHPYKTGSVW